MWQLPEKKHLRANPLNINTAFLLLWYLSNHVCAVLSETEVTLPGHKCSKSRESDKSSVPLCTQFSPDLKKSCMMVHNNIPATVGVKESFATSLTHRLIMRDCATRVNQLWDP